MGILTLNKIIVPKIKITRPIIILNNPGSAAFNANTPIGTAITPPKIIPLICLNCKCDLNSIKTTDNSKTIRTLAITTTDRGSRNKRRTGATTRANPKLTVPMIVAPRNTATLHIKISIPVNKLRIF